VGAGGLPGYRPATSHLLAAIMAGFSFLYLRLCSLTGSGSWCAVLGRAFAGGRLGRGGGTGLAGEELGNAGICKCKADGIGFITVAILG
jgi:hypothetical protein